MKNLYYSFRIGLIDGWTQPHYLSTGMTYDDLNCQEAYDRGTLVGQRLRSPRQCQRRIEGW